MKFLDLLNSNTSSSNSCKSIINLIKQVEVSSTQDDLAYLLAEKIVYYRCRRCLHHYNAWKNKINYGNPLSKSSELALKAFLEPSFGSPDGKPINVDHLEGFVGEWLWFFLFKELTQFPIIHEIPPGFKSTDPGGDAFVIQSDCNIGLFFRLWEMKKFSPRRSSSSQQIGGTITNAYSQLNSKASEYLARIMSTEQLLNNPEVEEFIGNILDHWINANNKATVGVSIATSSNFVKNDCFKDFSKVIPNFKDPFQLLGMITGVSDFSIFSKKVQEIIWEGS